MSLLEGAAAFITDFADEAVVLPAAVFVALALALAGWTRGAVVWMVAVAGTLGIMLGLKLVFGACGHRLGWGIESPSGHTAAAGVFYGSLVAYAAGQRFRRRAVEIGLVLLVILLVGWSRIVLGAHTLVEVSIGGIVGLCGALLFLRTAGAPPANQRKLAVLLLPAAGLLLVLHGFRLPAEAAIHRVAFEIWPLSACR